MRAYATVLAFAASALAYSVTAPTNATGFSNDGSNTVSWDRVSTDPQNFTIVLVNNNVFPNYEQVLDALVDGTQGSIQVNPPSTGWPSGTGYQINFVQDSQHLTTILAQSNDFSFHAPTSSGSSSASGSSTGSLSGSSASGSAATALTVSTTAPSSAKSTGSAGSASNSAGSSGAGSSGASDLNPSSSDTATTASQTNGAASAGAHAALFGAVALVGALLA